jgi:hypothetical protein
MDKEKRPNGRRSAVEMRVGRRGTGEMEEGDMEERRPVDGRQRKPETKEQRKNYISHFTSHVSLFTLLSLFTFHLSP